MNKDSLILKSAIRLMLMVLVYMHICSAWCALPSSSCCTNIENKSCLKSSGTDKKSSDHKAGDCQNFHLSFFKAIGQFSSEKNIMVTKVFEKSLPVDLSFYISSRFDYNQNIVVRKGFHPPPLTTDIRILIQSFQI